MEHLTFKQYLESKQRLREATSQTPIQEITYIISKYVQFPVNENDERVDISLKPKNRITVKWLYEDFEHPTPVDICFDGVQQVDNKQRFEALWKPKKIQSWLLRNTREEK